MRGLSFVAGGYMNEFELYDRIKNGDLDHVPGTFYAYMSGIVVLTIIGFIIQVKLLRRYNKNGDSDDYQGINSRV